MGNIIYPKPQPAGLLLDTLPNKTEYLVGETFDPTVMVIRMLMTDGTKQRVTSYSWSPAGSLGLDDDTVTVSSMGFTYTLHISVVAQRNLVGIQLANRPTRTKYVSGDRFNRS